MCKSEKQTDLPGEPPSRESSICELTPICLSLLFMLPALPLSVAACCMPLPMWLSTELLRGRSFDRPRYLLLGNRSVSENKFLLILIVRSKLWLSSFSSSLFSSTGKNFLDRAYTMGRLRI